MCFVWWTVGFSICAVGVICVAVFCAFYELGAFVVFACLSGCVILLVFDFGVFLLVWVCEFVASCVLGFLLITLVSWVFGFSLAGVFYCLGAWMGGFSFTLCLLLLFVGFLFAVCGLLLCACVFANFWFFNLCVCDNLVCVLGFYLLFLNVDCGWLELVLRGVCLGFAFWCFRLCFMVGCKFWFEVVLNLFFWFSCGLLISALCFVEFGWVSRCVLVFWVAGLLFGTCS